MSLVGRKRLAREAKALVAEQASVEQSSTPSGLPPTRDSNDGREREIDSGGIAEQVRNPLKPRLIPS